MSMSTAQVESLRIMARLVRDYDYREISRTLREAADTIEDLSERLTETCRNADARAEAGGVWNSPRFVCSECGATYVMSDYARFCPSCGRKVVDE